MPDVDVPAPSATVFRFTAQGVDLQFAGTEEFVEKQVARFRAFLQGAVGGGAPAPAEAARPAGQGQSVAEFFGARPVREGRGAIQDRILLSIYFMEHHQGKREVSGNDILWCFTQLGLGPVKNLHNTLGNLKRKLGHLVEGSRRGLYSLSPRGKAYVESRYTPA